MPFNRAKRETRHGEDGRFNPSAGARAQVRGMQSSLEISFESGRWDEKGFRF